MEYNCCATIATAQRDPPHTRNHDTSTRYEVHVTLRNARALSAITEQRNGDTRGAAIVGERPTNMAGNSSHFFFFSAYLPP